MLPYCTESKGLDHSAGIDGFLMFYHFRFAVIDDKLRQCAEIVLESLSCMSSREQMDFAMFLVPEVPRKT